MKTIICVFLLISAGCWGQPVNLLTLEQANALAAKNYPLIQQRELIRQTANLTIENLQKGFLPQVNVSGQASYQSAVTSLPIKLPNINIKSPSKDQYRIVTDINQLVYDGGAIQQQKKLQNLNAVVEDQKIEVELQKLRERINQLYLGVLLVDEQLKQVDVADKDINAGIKKIEAQIKNGTALRSNLAVLKAQLLTNEQRRIELRSTRNSLLDVLSLFINQPIAYDVVLTRPIVASPLLNAGNERSELRLFQLQDSLLSTQSYLINIKNKPRISLFAQGGYGRPGLNMLQNNFALFGIGGVRFNWALSNLYTSKKEKQLVDISRRTVDIQKQTFLLNTNASIKQQQDEIQKMQALIEVDKQIIELREQVTVASHAQLENGVLMASDYIREVNAADLARQNLALHQLQLLQSQINYLTILGK